MSNAPAGENFEKEKNRTLSHQQHNHVLVVATARRNKFCEVLHQDHLELLETHFDRYHEHALLSIDPAIGPFYKGKFRSYC